MSNSSLHDKFTTLGAALTGPPRKQPVIRPPPNTRMSTRASFCTAPQGELRILAESSDGELHRVDEISSAPSSPSTVGSQSRSWGSERSSAGESWLSDERRARSYAEGTSYAEDLDVDEWARTPLPNRRALHNSLWPTDSRLAAPGPPPDHPIPPVPSSPRPLPRRPLRSPHRPLPSRPHDATEGSSAGDSTHTRSFSDSCMPSQRRALPPPPLDLSSVKAIPATQTKVAPQALDAERVVHPAAQMRSMQHQNLTRNRSLSSLASESAEGLKRSGSRLQRIGRIPAHAAPGTIKAGAFPRPPQPVTKEHGATQHPFAHVQKASEVKQARAVRPQPKVIVDLGGFHQDDADTRRSRRYAYHDSDGFDSRDRRGDNGLRPCEPGVVTPVRAPTQSALLRAIEAQIQFSGPVDFTPAPSPVSRRGTRHVPTPPLRVETRAPPLPTTERKFPTPIAEAMMALVGTRDRLKGLGKEVKKDAEIEKQNLASSVVELGDAAGDSERKDKYTFKPPRGLLPSMPGAPRSEMRQEVMSPDSEMHNVPLTPLTTVDFSKPRTYSASTPAKPWFTNALKRMSQLPPLRLSTAAGTGFGGSKPAKPASINLSDRPRNVRIDLPSAVSTARASISPLTPRTPRRAEGGILPRLQSIRKAKLERPRSPDKQRKKLMIGLMVGIVVVLLILVPVLITQNKRPSRDTPEQAVNTEAANRCVQAWNAGDQRNFTCESCVPLLRTLPNDFAANGTAGVGGALQYCALMEIWDDVEADAGLKGWGQTQSPCAWAGVGCDSLGRVVSLELRAPAMPRTMPNLDDLVALAQLRLKGDGNAPVGALAAPPALSLLNAEYTALQEIKVGNASAVVLVHNPHLELPDLSGSNVTTLAATYQNLTSVDIAKLPKGLEYLDLSFNELEGKLPDIDLPLRSLYVQGNGLKGLGNLPDSLENVNLSDNPLENAGGLCKGKFNLCDLRQTGLKVTSCGTCLLD